MKKILLVDDIKLLLEKQKRILSRSDFKIFTATSGEEAINIHRTEKVDLIITDLDMPGISGDQLCSIIRKDDSLKKVSIIILCTNNKANLERCLSSKANLCVTKPIDQVKLLEKVSHFLNIPERESCRVLLNVKVRGKFENESFFCFSLNISNSGILLETDKNLTMGDCISCSFFLPDSGQLDIDGEVMRVVGKHTDKYQYGIKFLNLDPIYKSAIHKFIQKRAKKSFSDVNRSGDFFN